MTARPDRRRHYLDVEVFDRAGRWRSRPCRGRRGRRGGRRGRRRDDLRQRGVHRGGVRAKWKVSAQRSGGVDGIDVGRVSHLVFAGRCRVDPGVANIPGRRRLTDLLVGSGHEGKARRRVARVVGEPGRRIAFGIDGHEHSLDRRRSLGDRVTYGPDGERAHVRAMGIAKEDQLRRAAMGRQREVAAIAGGQLDRRRGLGVGVEERLAGSWNGRQRRRRRRRRLAATRWTGHSQHD